MSAPTTTTPAPPTTRAGTVQLGPGPAQGAIPGSHQDGADLWGILVALAVMAVAVVAVRALFRRGGHQVTRQR